MFELKGNNRIVVRKNYARMLSKGKLCPSEPSNQVKIRVISDVLGARDFEFTIFTEVPPPKPNSTWKPQFTSFNRREMVLEEVFAEVSGELFKLPYLEIESIDRNGLMIIHFSEPMKVIDSANELKTK